MVILTAMCAISCDKKEAAEDYPMFWTWLDYRPNMDFEAVCQKMQAAGIDGVMLNAPTPEDYNVAIPVAHKYGITVHAWLWTMDLEHDRAKVLAEHPDWFSVNRLGVSLAEKPAYVDYYRFLCPALPEVREYLNNKIKAYCEVEGLEGIALDYHRFVDVVLPTSLWSRYGIVQDQEYPEWDYGYHPAMIEKFKKQYGYDPREQEDPSQDLKWRQFRCDQITEVANLFAETIHKYGKKMSASPFPTPKMASRMVRQDWGKWNLDLVFPMAYHNFYTMDPSFEYDCTVENVRDAQAMTTVGCGMTYSEDIIPCMREAFRAGAQAVAIFTVQSMRTDEQIAEFRAFTDSIRAVKAANGGKLPAVNNPAAADANPFNHPVMMAQIEKRMQQDVSGWVKPDPRARRRGEQIQQPPLKDVKFGEYAFIGEHGITKDYQVTEQNSGQKFKVTFYFYGDIISGWDVSKM